MVERKTAIVTGGARGIGLAIARELIYQGANVVICSRHKNQIETSVKELSITGEKALGIVADVSLLADCQKLVDYAYSQTGRIDILVNNAGIFGPVGLLETNNPEGWENVLAINILGPVNCCRLVIPYMKKQGAGKIINLAGAGVGGTKTIPRFSAYYTTKMAVVGFTECLAAELESYNIQVNAISPGAVASNLTLELLDLPKEDVGKEMYETSQRLKAGESSPPELAANLVAFLISPEADRVTGRLISAKWDDYRSWVGKKIKSENLYRLRRIDNNNFHEKEVP